MVLRSYVVLFVNDSGDPNVNKDEKKKRKNRKKTEYHSHRLYFSSSLNSTSPKNTSDITFKE